ncbi:MAG: DUF1127 domain-containing protein [Proteobacteria bacterium]|nr:DUF1127 domain-containing protein [Pseudomonadota bacterium]
MSATKLSPTLNGLYSAAQVETALEARRVRGQALAAIAADGIGAIGSGLKTLFSRFKNWNERRSTFLELEGLDDRILADIGLSRGEIAQVAAGHYVRQQDGFKYLAKPVQPANAQVAAAKAA